MEHAAFHLRSAGLNPKAVTIWRSFGGIPVTSWAVLGPNETVKRSPMLAWCLVSPSEGLWRAGEGAQALPAAFGSPWDKCSPSFMGVSCCCIPQGTGELTTPQKTVKSTLSRKGQPRSS